MGSQLEEYVHLKWEDYKKHGIQQEGQGMPLDFEKAHKKLFNKIINQNRVSRLKKIEREYNQSANNLIASFAKLENKQGLWAAVIKNANLDNIFQIDNDVLAYVDSIIEINETNKTIQLKEGKSFKTNIENMPSALRARKRAAKIKDLEEYFEALKDSYNKVLENNKGNSSVIKGFKKFFKLNAGKKIEPLTKIFLNLHKQEEDTKNPTIEPKPANRLISELNAFRKAIKGVDYFYSLQASFAEVLGTVIGVKGKSISNEAMAEVFKQLASEGAVGLGRVKTNRGGTFGELAFENLDKNSLKNIANELKKEAQLSDKEFNNIFKDNEVGASLIVDYSQPNKADFELYLEGKNDPIGVSMKNVSFNTFGGNTIKGNINFQDSPLLFYLIGMQQQQEWNGLGTHMLNNLVQHEDSNEKNIIARHFLIEWILYSALSGRLQGAGLDAKMADILVVQPKNSPTAMVFDISQLVADLVKSNEIKNLPMYEEILNLNLINTKVVGSDNQEALMKIRLAKILIQARVQRIKAYIPKNVIESYNNRNKKN